MTSKKIDKTKEVAQRGLPSRAEVRKLKQQWMVDPTWDIEDTEGFEKIRAHLKQFRLQQEEKWQQEDAEQFAKDAADIGVHVGHMANINHYTLAETILTMKDRISKLEEQLEEVQTDIR